MTDRKLEVAGVEMNTGLDDRWTVIEAIVLLKTIDNDHSHPSYHFRSSEGLSMPEAIGMLEATSMDLKLDWHNIVKPVDGEDD
jgi:hypothetical protein